eukprot:6214888-Ditylum_brightwellii.AAC.1
MQVPDWEWENQDGSEEKKGIIIKGCKTGEVVVRWNDSPVDKDLYCARQNGKHDLVFARKPLLPPQG